MAKHDSKLRVCWAMLIAALCWPLQSAHALPGTTLTVLPLSAADASALQERLGPQKLAALRDLLARHMVYEDTANASLRPRVYYHAPFFSADPAAGVIGEQRIDLDGLRLLDAFDALLARLAVSPILLARLELLAREYARLVTRLTPLLRGVDVESVMRVSAAAPELESPWSLQARQLRAQLTAGVTALPDSGRQELSGALTPIANQLELSVPARPSADELLQALAELRARLANRTYGVRRATFVSGLTRAEADLFSSYLSQKTDLVVRPLPLTKVFVSAVSQTTVQSGLLPDRVLGPELIRSVNAASQGACGRRDSCEVVIEYTELGARTALLATFGPSLMPVIFSGDVRCATADVGPGKGEQLKALSVGNVELGSVVLEPLQSPARGAADGRTLRVDVNVLIDTGETPVRAAERTLQTARVLPPRPRSGLTRLYFDGFPIVCFDHARDLSHTDIVACDEERDPEPPGSQISCYEDTINQHCPNVGFERCIELLSPMH